MVHCVPCWCTIILHGFSETHQEHVTHFCKQCQGAATCPQSTFRAGKNVQFDVVPSLIYSVHSLLRSILTPEHNFNIVVTKEQGTSL